MEAIVPALSSPQRPNLAEKKEAALRLQKLEQELRSAVQARIPAGQKVSEAARTFGVSWNELSRFLTEDRPVCGGKTLRNLAENSGRPELERAIEDTVRGIPDSMRGVAAYTESIIEIFFELHQLVAMSGHGVEKFALSRGEHADVIRRVFWGKREALDKLKNPSFVKKFRNAIQAEGEFELPNLVVELRAIIKQLRPYFETKAEIAAALGVRTERLNTNSGRNVLPILEKARTILASKGSESGTAGSAQHSKQSTPESAKIKVAPVQEDDAHTLMNSAISALHSTTNIIGTLCKNNELVIDGNRMHAVRIARKLLVAFGIDAQTIHRLQKVEAITLADSKLLEEILGAVRPSKTDRTRRRHR